MSQVIVSKKTVGPFNGSIVLKCGSVEKQFRQKDMRSALQKAIRRQDWPRAKQVVTHYMMLNEGTKAQMTWLFNRIVVIAKGGCL
jgi:hypothetical protein